MKSALIALLALPAIVAAAPAPKVKREPPGIPSATEAKEHLANLQVAPLGSQDGYSRDLFPHWSSQEGACNTREVVLKRDGEGVEQGSDCAAESGTWESPYDDEGPWTDAQDVDIDHMVPLSNAWKSGANEWTTSEREAFANDIENPQLWAVTDNVNQEKGDQSPDQWKPPKESFYCTYASAWVKVKDVYKLTITEAEKDALTEMLGAC